MKKTSIHLSEYADETSLKTTWHLPKAHFLEAWGDARTWDGTICVAQPLIARKVRRVVDRLEIAPVLCIGLDRRPLVDGVGAIFLGLCVAFLHHLRITVTFVDGLLLADILALVVAGNIIGIRRCAAGLIAMSDGLDLLHWHGCLPADIGHGRLHGLGRNCQQTNNGSYGNTADDQEARDRRQAQPLEGDTAGGRHREDQQQLFESVEAQARELALMRPSASISA